MLPTEGQQMKAYHSVMPAAVIRRPLANIEKGRRPKPKPYRDCEKREAPVRVDVRTEAPGDEPAGKPAPTILSEKTLHYYDV
jgi:hypothetical protein